MSDVLQEIKDYLDSIENNTRGISFARNYKQAQTCIKTVADCKEAVLSLFQKLDREYWELLERFGQLQTKAEQYEKAIKECVERMDKGGLGTRIFVYEKLTGVMEGTQCTGK